MNGPTRLPQRRPNLRLVQAPELLLTKRQLAEKIQFSEGWIEKQMRENDFPHLRFGRAVRFQPSEVYRWLREHGKMAA